MKSKIVQILTKHPRLRTLGISFGVVLAISIAIGTAAEIQQVFAGNYCYYPGWGWDVCHMK